MIHININVPAFSHGTYTFSWIRQKKPPSQLVSELSKKNTVINVNMSPPILRRTKPIRIKMEEVIEVSSITVNHRTNQVINSTNVPLSVYNSEEQSSEEFDDSSFGFFNFFE